MKKKTIKKQETIDVSKINWKKLTPMEALKLSKHVMIKAGKTNAVKLVHSCR